jgi:hypothetical protein
MKKTITILGFLGALGFAETMPNTFSAGESISAAKINENFTYLLSKANSLITKKFVGVSTETHDGDDGVIAMNASCNAVYTGSTICEINDIFNSSLLSGTGNAWIYSNINHLNSVDSLQNCNHFNSTGNNGGNAYIVKLPSGSIDNASEYCATANPIACCR